MEFLENIKKHVDRGTIPPQIAATIQSFYSSFSSAVQNGQGKVEDHHPLLNKFLELVLDQIQEPYLFSLYHEKVTAPFDYYRFGLDFLRPVVKLSQSTIVGEEKIVEIEGHIRKGENVILFSNHQTEPDPQAISLLLEKNHSKLAQEMIFIAGHRVTTDPVAVPFSLGRNLLCIYSKNYLEHPPEKKHEKVRHNQRTMKKMRELLSQGGCCIYVAPSGGRDRANEHGVIEVALFDGQSIEMFWFTANHSLKPTHFYPMALFTYDLLPPPKGIHVALGETRQTQRTPIHLAFGDRIDMEGFQGSEITDMKRKRGERAEHIWGMVKKLYQSIQPQK